MSDCLGCRIAAGKVHIPGGDIWRDDWWQAGHDPSNTIPGFLVLGTIRHVRNVIEIPEATLLFGQRLIWATRKVLHEQFGLAEYVTYQDDSTSGHYHTWLLPIYPEMAPFGRLPGSMIPFLRWTRDAWRTPERMRQIDHIAAVLRKHLQATLGHNS
jgi:diadenosine tetraphosphate (Ap4A) HIT family hydrolase